MKTLRPHSALFLAAAFFAAPLRAEEAASGHYLPGAFATMTDFPAEKPGFALSVQFLYYKADAGANVTLPYGGLLPVNLEGETQVGLVIGTYTFEQKVLGGSYTVAAGVPLVDLEVTATLGGLRVRDGDSGVSDCILIPAMLQWRHGHWQYGFIGAVYAPTGDYDSGRLANVGKNYWTFEPTVAVNHLNPKSLVEFSAFAGLDFNTQNEDTDYQTGDQFHLEASLLKNFAHAGALYGIGVNGFYYQQITGDSGRGATLGDFEGMTTGIGPVFRFIQEGRSQTSFLEIKWLPELDTERRLEGDYVWIKFGCTL